MEEFIKAYNHFKNIKHLGYYRFCWIPMSNSKGLYSVIEFFDDELDKIDKNKVEIIIY